MFKNLSLKMKFTIIMVIVGFVANLTVAIGAFYYIQIYKQGYYKADTGYDQISLRCLSRQIKRGF